MGHTRPDLRCRIVTPMESTLAAEEIPGLYRTVLDGVAELERGGRRAEAHRVRRAATKAYSAAWDDASHRRLSILVARLDRALAGPDPGRTPGRVPRSALELSIRLALSRRPTSTR